jgi:adenylate cyclase class IV
MEHVNWELKARDPSPERSLAVCRALRARAKGEIWQRDVYFDVPLGRLKLRDEKPGQPHLIHYVRADNSREPASRYRTAMVENAATTTELLSACLHHWCTVTKRRQLFLWNEVRIHLDEVDQLGSFIEFEVPRQIGSDLQRGYELIEELTAAFSIDAAQLVTTGYADQLLLR